MPLACFSGDGLEVAKAGLLACCVIETMDRRHGNCIEGSAFVVNARGVQGRRRHVRSRKADRRSDMAGRRSTMEVQVVAGSRRVDFVEDEREVFED